jgi:hypothetical protein
MAPANQIPENGPDGLSPRYRSPVVRGVNWPTTRAAANAPLWKIATEPEALSYVMATCCHCPTVTRLIGVPTLWDTPDESTRFT